MKKSVKRWLAISLMALMVLTMIPSGVFAVEGVFPMGDGVVILNSTEDFTADTVSVEDEIISSEPAEQNNEEMILPDIETEPVLLETNLTESAETETLETLETEEATDEIWETETYVTDTETENAVMTEPVSELAVDAEAGDNIESEEETTCATEAGYGLIGMDTLNAQVKKTIARAPSTTKVTLHPAVITPTGVKVSVGGTIDGKPIVAINGYDIIVDMGVYNTHNNYSFRLPYASELWEGVGKVDYISWTGTGSNSPSEGQSVSVANAGSSAYYYFKTVTYRTFTLNYNANGGTGEPPSQSYTATSQYEYSHTFSISNIKPTRDGYKFLGWAESSSATSASRQPGGSIYVSGTTTLFAVWEKEEEKPTAAGNSTVNITKTFSKDITTVPNGFGLQYTYTNLATGQTVSGTVPMTGSGSTLSGSISIPYYNNVAEGTPYYLSLTEVNADVSGYNLQIKSDIGQIDQAQKVISYAMPVSNKSTLNRTIENVYTAVEKRYTVTYTDGVDGEEIFADQVTENILSGTKTPEFEGGTPVRKDYVFAGWSPAVAETVTADATYTATWKEDKNNNGTPDDEEDRYTVTYTDGVDGEEIFAD
ncbi:MAG: InlB B-repeat-containing protein, partial [Eubacteriales bacterium]|nr:InlB B-repeat-containing protein [Eubacteriales bacterium]